MTTRAHENSSSTVSLDSRQIKRYREEQKLTQLYVSKMVGVTTDTISRWENNRYPAIRRENALKLAEALEVPLEAILQQPEEEPVEPTPIDDRRIPVIWIALGVLAVALLVVYLTLFMRQPPPPAPVTAQRILPIHAGPGAIVPVQVTLTHRASGSGFILREYFPKGWKLLQSYPPTSSLDNVNGVARWIIKGGAVVDRVVYLVQTSDVVDIGAEINFQGEVVAGGERNQSAVAILGDDKVKIAPYHWADDNGDGQIDDGEMLQASFTLEEMEGVHIDWNHLESLWDAGSYQWDGDLGRYVPVRMKVEEN